MKRWIAAAAAIRLALFGVLSPACAAVVTAPIQVAPVQVPVPGPVVLPVSGMAPLQGPLQTGLSSLSGPSALTPSVIPLPTPAVAASPLPAAAAATPSARESLTAQTPLKGQVPGVGEGRKIAEVQPAARRGDLSPAGPVQRMDFKTLWSLPVQWEGIQEHKQAYANLRWVLSTDPAALGQIFDAIKADPRVFTTTLDGMFMSLRSVLRSPLPASERYPAAVSLAQTYAGFLLNLRRRPGLPDSVLRRSEEVLRDFFVENVFVEEFARRIMLDDKLRQLMPPPSLNPARGQTQGRSAPSVMSETPWTMSPPIPAGSRKSTDREFSFVKKLQDLDTRLREVLFQKERLERRLDLAREKGFSRDFVQARAVELAIYLRDTVKPILGYAVNGVSRVTDILFRNQFLLGRGYAGDHKTAIFKSDKAHLVLTPEPGGFVVRAALESDIQEAWVLDAVKRSIEEYWQGSFELDGRTVHLRVEVSILRLAPGQPFSAGALKVAEGTTVSHARPDGMYLSRSFSYHTPAHEFGHLLGLPDEYSEVYDGPSRASIHMQNEGSLMGGAAGVLHPRHFRMAYDDLK